VDFAERGGEDFAEIEGFVWIVCAYYHLFALLSQWDILQNFNNCSFDCCIPRLKRINDRPNLT